MKSKRTVRCALMIWLHPTRPLGHPLHEPVAERVGGPDRSVSVSRFYGCQLGTSEPCCLGRRTIRISSDSNIMNRERLVAQSCSRNINQMAMMRKDHDLPALGKSRQRAKDVRRAFIV